MKHSNFLFFAFVLSLLTLSTTSAQPYINGGMGLSLNNISELRNYLNNYYAPSDNQIGVFSTAVEFSGEAGYTFNDYTISIDAGYEMNSYNYTVIGSLYEMKYSIFKPSLLYMKLFMGKGYYFRIGGGLGLRFTTVSEKQFPSNIFKDFTSTGWGVLIKADASTLLSDGVFAVIGGGIRYDVLGKPQNNGLGIKSPLANNELNFNEFSFLLSIGVSYHF